MRQCSWLKETNRTHNRSGGEIRYNLEKKGQTIGPLDMLTAAHALSNDIILVTNNEKQFQRINHLKIENWIQ
jgi:tRNA(fMet)-specific endonuclease VapC